MQIRIADVVKSYREQIRACTDTDQINKIYRQARIWSRIMYVWCGYLTAEEHDRLNLALKRIKFNNLKKFEKEVN